MHNYSDNDDSSYSPDSDTSDSSIIDTSSSTSEERRPTKKRVIKRNAAIKPAPKRQFTEKLANKREVANYVYSVFTDKSSLGRDKISVLTKCNNADINNTFACAKALDIVAADYVAPTMDEILLNARIAPINKAALINDRLVLDSYYFYDPKYYTLLLSIRARIKHYNTSDTTTLVNAFIAEMRDAEHATPIINRIALSDYPASIKAIIYKNSMEPDAKYARWVNTALAIPTRSFMIDTARCAELLSNLSNKLNRDIYGMKRVKEEILEYVDDTYFRISDFSNTKIADTGKTTTENKILSLIGPPGVGKTLLAQSIAGELGLPFAQISVGGAYESSFLDGHEFTFTGAEPGAIVKALITMKYNNGIIYIDEVDKLGRQKDVGSALLRVLDYTQNSDFRDKYLTEIPINLSNFIFVISLNSLDEIDPALASRLAPVRVDGYTTTEKVNIMKTIMIPKCLKSYLFSDFDILFGDRTIEHLINMSKESCSIAHKTTGVRALKNNLNRVVKHLAYARKMAGKMELTSGITTFNTPFKVTTALIDKLIDRAEVSDAVQSMYR